MRVVSASRPAELPAFWLRGPGDLQTRWFPPIPDLRSGPPAGPLLQLWEGLVQQFDQFERRPPSIGLFHAEGNCHGARQTGKHQLRICPARTIQDLEGLVGEVQGMAFINVTVIRSG